MALPDDRFPAQRQCLRKSQRERLFAAGLLTRNVHSEPLNCLIRDISIGGAQIRVRAAGPVPDPGFLINLKARTVHLSHTVWRRGSLAGLSFDGMHVINDLLPAHLNFLKRLFIEGKLHQADQLISEGMQLVAALRKCDIAEDIYWQNRGIIFPKASTFRDGTQH